jgi:hypothetical protein
VLPETALPADHHAGQLILVVKEHNGVTAGRRPQPSRLEDLAPAKGQADFVGDTAGVAGYGCLLTTTLDKLLKGKSGAVGTASLSYQKTALERGYQ